MTVLACDADNARGLGVRRVVRAEVQPVADAGDADDDRAVYGEWRHVREEPALTGHTVLREGIARGELGTILDRTAGLGGERNVPVDGTGRAIECDEARVDRREINAAVGERRTAIRGAAARRMPQRVTVSPALRARRGVEGDDVVVRRGQEHRSGVDERRRLEAAAALRVERPRRLQRRDVCAIDRPQRGEVPIGVAVTRGQLIGAVAGGVEEPRVGDVGRRIRRSSRLVRCREQRADAHRSRPIARRGPWYNDADVMPPSTRGQRFLSRGATAERPEHAAWILFATIVGSGMAFIDSSAVNVALPQVGRELHATAAGLQWVIESYALFLAALILVGGSLGDVYGRRRIFVVGIALFAAASAACALAPCLLFLDVARAIQGAGGALATPGSLALISASFAGAARGRAIGTWSGAAAITAAIGPLLGGWLAQAVSWRAVFVINVPLAVAVIAAALARVPESRDDDGPRHVDVPGALLATLALGALTAGCIELQGGPGAFAVSAVASGAALAAAFAWWEHRAPAPMVPPAIFASRTFAGANLYTFVLYAALGGSFFFIPIDLENVHGYTPAAAGAAMLPFIVLVSLGSRWAGGLVDSIGARVPLVAGALVTAAGFVAYARIGSGGAYLTTFFPASLLAGLGGALFVAPLTTTVMSALDESRAGVASGTNNAVSRVASLLAIAILGIVLVASVHTRFDAAVATIRPPAAMRAMLARERATLATGRLPDAARGPDRPKLARALADAYTLGFRRVMLASAALCVIAALLAWVTITRPDSQASARNATG